MSAKKTKITHACYGMRLPLFVEQLVCQPPEGLSAQLKGALWRFIDYADVIGTDTYPTMQEIRQLSDLTKVKRIGSKCAEFIFQEWLQCVGSVPGYGQPAKMAATLKSVPMRPTFANKKINRLVVRSWEFYQEEYRRFLAMGIRGLCEESRLEMDRYLRQKLVPSWFLGTRRARELYILEVTAERYFQDLWESFHLGMRCGMREAGADDDKIPGFSRGNPDEDTGKGA